MATTWDNTSSGYNNSDTIGGVTVDFSSFGGGCAVMATNSNGTWTATYILMSGSIDSASNNVIVTAMDDAGNSTTTPDTSDVTVDTVTITEDPSGVAKSAVIYTFTFSEAVLDFTVADITVSGGTKGVLTSNDAHMAYTLVATPAFTTGDAGVGMTVDVAADVATDVAGNGNEAAVQNVQAHENLNVVSRPLYRLQSGWRSPSSACVRRLGTRGFSIYKISCTPLD